MGHCIRGLKGGLHLSVARELTGAISLDGINLVQTAKISVAVCGTMICQAGDGVLHGEVTLGNSKVGENGMAETDDGEVASISYYGETGIPNPLQRAFKDGGVDCGSRSESIDGGERVFRKVDVRVGFCRLFG